MGKKRQKLNLFTWLKNISLRLFHREVFGLPHKNGIVHLYIACSNAKTNIAATNPEVKNKV